MALKFLIHITPSSAGDPAPQWSNGVSLSSTIANCVGPNPTGVMLWDYHAALCSNSEHHPKNSIKSSGHGIWHTEKVLETNDRK